MAETYTAAFLSDEGVYAIARTDSPNDAIMGALKKCQELGGQDFYVPKDANGEHMVGDAQQLYQLQFQYYQRIGKDQPLVLALVTLLKAPRMQRWTAVWIMVEVCLRSKEYARITRLKITPNNHAASEWFYVQCLLETDVYARHIIDIHPTTILIIPPSLFCQHASFALLR